MTLPEIPHIVRETGVSGDYANEYAVWISLLQSSLLQSGVPILYEHLKESYQVNGKAIRSYGERFQNYRQPTDVMALERIRNLDLIAQALNLLVEMEKFGSLTKDECCGILTRVCDLIYGDPQTVYRQGIQRRWEVYLYTEKLGFTD